MKVLACSIVVLVLLCGCSSISSRARQESASYNSLSPSERDLVDKGQIARGMSSNAVYIAWGKPTQVIPQSSAAGTDEEATWLYYGNQPVITPAWSFIPDPYGYGRLEYMPQHHSERYLKGAVHLQNGRVTSWQKY